MDNLLAHLLMEATGRAGTFDPDECLYSVEESMTLPQYETAEAFLRWCHDNGKTFGHNIMTVFAEFKQTA